MTDATPYPPEEIARLQEIADLELTAPEVGAILQDLTEEAAAALDLPVALVSVVLDRVQFFAAAHGLEGWIAEAGGTPKEWSFCQHVVADKAPLRVEDASKDPRVAGSPLVTQDGIACYLGMPIMTSRGHALGSLCVVGGEPRTFSARDHEVLEAITARAVERIESRHRAG